MLKKICYLSVNLDAIGDVIDILGGLTITMLEDYSYIDPSYTKGAVVTLDSWGVEWLLRYRDKSQLESNDDRMIFQRIGTVFRERTEQGRFMRSFM